MIKVVRECCITIAFLSQQIKHKVVINLFFKRKMLRIEMETYIYNNKLLVYNIQTKYKILYLIRSTIEIFNLT